MSILVVKGLMGWLMAWGLLKLKTHKNGKRKGGYHRVIDN